MFAVRADHSVMYDDVGESAVRANLDVLVVEQLNWQKRLYC